MTQSRAPLIMAIVLLLVPVLYVGSYFALVLPPGKLPATTVAGSLFVSPQGIIKLSHYRIFPSAAEKFYWPLEQLDRKVRPGAWQFNRQAARQWYRSGAPPMNEWLSR